MKKVPVEAAAGRLINAVAKIGYDPEVALCDLIDNSFDAKASNINVILEPESNEDEGAGDSVSRYIIADDGCGMNESELINAFTLGAKREYETHSLGKFGIGLKSAGLSLGRKLTIISKRKVDSDPFCAVLSIDDIEASGQYQIDLGLADEPARLTWQNTATDSEKGTILIIEELNDNQPSFGTFLTYFQRYCGLTYHMFLEDEVEKRVLRVNGTAVSPIDPLFLVEARQNGELPKPADLWSGKTCNLLFEDSQLSLNDQVRCTITATNLVHPPSFGSDRSIVRDKYGIEQDPYTHRPRHGFYIYRNRRIITMAERFRGVISSATQAWAFRGRLMFDESADSQLDLDVKKRHCQLPRDARSSLKSMVAVYQTRSQEAWKVAGRRVEELRNESKETIANESIANAPVTGLDYAPGAELSTSTAIKERKDRQAEVSAQTLSALQDDDVTRQSLDVSAAKREVVVSVKGLKANAMWLPYASATVGVAETIINKGNSWIAEAYAGAEQDGRLTIVLHQLFTILSRAELEVRTAKWPDVSEAALDKIFDRFRRKASSIAEDLAESLEAELAKLNTDAKEEE